MLDCLSSFLSSPALFPQVMDAEHVRKWMALSVVAVAGRGARLTSAGQSHTIGECKVGHGEDHGAFIRPLPGDRGE